MVRKREIKKEKNRKRYHDDEEDARHSHLKRGMSGETKKGLVALVLLLVAVLLFLSYFDLAGALSVKAVHVLKLGFGWGSFLLPAFLIAVAIMLVVGARYHFGPTSYVGIVLLVLSFYGLLHVFVPLEESLSVIVSGRGGGYVGLFLSYPLYSVIGKWGALAVLFTLFVASWLIILNTTLMVIFKGIKIAAWPLGPLFRWVKTGSFNPSVNSTVASGDGRQDEYEAYEEEEEVGSPSVRSARSGPTEDEVDDVPTEEEVVSKKKKGFFRKSFGRKEEAEELPLAKQPLLSRRRVAITLPLGLLNGKPGKATSGDIKANQAVIKKTLQNFGIEVEMGNVSIGPTVTQYTLKPAEGVKLSQITSLHNDLALALAAHPIRIEAPIPGKALVGIEVPNQTVALVTLKEILDSDEFRGRKSNLTIALGKDVAGKPWFAQLEKMPHMLIAGATGSGKTVSINTILISLLYQNSPEDLKLILIDPKRVELPLYDGIPHLLTPVVTEVPKTVNALKWCIGEMERRFELLSKMGKRNIQTYNNEVEDKMPYIVVIIDELADLMVAAPHEVEGNIIRLAQMARAVGIHLILATQRPSVDIITGLIKANITSRIAFSVASLVDSRTILDMSGAEKLLGKGDMLFISAELSKPKRLQGAFIADEEISQVVNFLKREGEPEYDEEVIVRQRNNNGSNWAGGDDDSDELLEEAIEVVRQAGKASASLLQRRIKVGYARAARLLDLMEERGIVGPADGAKPREVMVTSEAVDEEIQEDIGQEEEGDDVKLLN